MLGGFPCLHDWKLPKTMSFPGIVAAICEFSRTVTAEVQEVEENMSTHHVTLGRGKDGHGPDASCAVISPRRAKEQLFLVPSQSSREN